MKLDRVRTSRNVEDRRGGVARKGIALSGGTAVLVVIFALVTKQNPLELLSTLNQGAAQQASAGAAAPVDPNDPGAVFVKKILATTEDVWNAELPKLGARYQEPKLVLYREAVESACGFQQAAVGPFYCQADQIAYFDLDFLDQLQKKLGAEGDFAAAYVIAHEIGHHVQKLLGTFERVRSGGRDQGATSNSVRLELQADCYAGVWGHYAKAQGLLEAGDAEEGLKAASAVGDDTIQRRGRGRVTPETFSHGTGEQRMRWFKTGMDTGDPRRCDTFQTDSL